MNENYRNNYNDEMEINLVDMVFYLLKQWKSLLIVATLGLLLGGGIWKLKVISTDKNVAVEQPEISTSVNQSMELAYRYRQLYWGQLTYNLNSILMKLDSNGVYTGTLKYYISAGDNTELIGLLYQNMISKQDFVQRVKEGASIDSEERYVRELMDCTLSRNENGVINIENPGSKMQSIEVTYSIIYNNMEVCESVLNIIREESETLRKECQEKYGEYIQETVFDEVQFVADCSRLDIQKSNIDMMNAWFTESVKQEASFTDEEKAYFEMVYFGVQSNETGNGQSASKSSMMKWLLVGIMLGIVCWGGYYFVKYLFDKRVKYAEELANYYGLHLIGRYKSEGKETKGIDKIQEQIVNRNAGSCSSKEYIASAINMLDEKSLLLIGDRKDQEVEVLMKEIGETCPKAGCGNLMQNDSETLERAKERAGIVLCVRKGKSTHTEIQRELEICRLQNIHVVGTVVVE